MNPGTQLGSYEILSPLGKGGMGEVWRARDQKLGREVAIKTLPEEFAKDEERLARFEREAKLLASLNHPNIAAIYGLEQHEGTRFLVLELVEGDTLAERLKRGAIPVEESLKLALQIAEALEAAHEKGVIHRDLKPANIKVTPDGKVKVLDFGLAKAFAGDGSDVNLSQSPTLSMAATQQGVILGTAAYMSPEQARGRTVDKRADIWAFGVVVYEMLTGKKAFESEDVSLTLAEVMKGEPHWALLPSDTPSPVRRLLRRCLEKDPRNRLRDIGDAVAEVNEISEEGTEEQDTGTAELTLRRTAVVAIVAAVVGVALSSAVWYSQIRFLDGQPVKRFVIQTPPGVQLGGGFGGNFIAISPGGNQLAYVANEGEDSWQLYRQPLDSVVSVPITGTDFARHPFFSPDGQWLAFFAQGSLKKVLLPDGRPLTVSEPGPTTRGGTWAPDDTIIFGGINSGLMRVLASAGTPQALTTLDMEAGEFAHRWPEMLPDGQSLLFTVFRETGRLEDARVAVLSLETGVRRYLLDEESSNARYSPTGHLIYVRSGTVMAVRFDLDRLEVLGTPIPVLDDVAVRGRGASHFGLASDGTLTYISTEARYENSTFSEISSAFAQGSDVLAWWNRDGPEDLPLEIVESDVSFAAPPQLSPDERRIAAAIVAGDGSQDIWVLDLERRNRRRLTSTGEETQPVWTPDGLRIAFASEVSGNRTELYWTAADGSTEPEPLLLERETSLIPGSWTPDGSVLAFSEFDANDIIGGSDIWIFPGNNETGIAPFVQGPFSQSQPRFSPNGRWIAYVSDESGRNEVYVTEYPASAAKYLISTTGGGNPLWSDNTEELFYVRQNQVLVVAIGDQTEFVPAPPEVLFEVEEVDFVTLTGVTSDGQRLLVGLSGTTPITEINIVLNWFEELKERVPVP